MDILSLIKNRATIRKYQNKPIPKEILDKIIEAGVWGPSIPSFLRIQPWKFVVITDKNIINKLSELLLNSKNKSKSGVSILLGSASKIVEGAAAVIAIYNSKDLDKLKDKYKEAISQFSEVIPKAELAAISAAIQNMIITAESLGIGSCWLDMPLFCEKEINRTLDIGHKLVAFLTLGYPAEEGKRSPRKPITEMVIYKE